MMRALDLFSAAAGGWSLGLHRAGFVTVAACEIVEWRRILYAENNPHVRLYEDVRGLTAARLVSDLGFLPDIIVGSPPCQDISSANTKGKGIEGEHSGLYLEAVRLVGECRPRWFAFENSANLRTRGADRLLLLLETLGYACEPCVVAAENVGANHVRKRSWLIGYDPGQLADAGIAIAAGRHPSGGWIGRPQGDEGIGPVRPVPREEAADPDGDGRDDGRRGRRSGIDISAADDPGDAAQIGRGQAKLRELGTRGDIIRTIGQALKDHGQGRPLDSYAIVNAPPEKPIVGRLIDKGLHDELHGSAYAVIDGTDGRTHHVRLPGIEALERSPDIGGIVELRAVGRAGERKPALFLATRSDLDLAAQVKAPGATWLDRRLIERGTGVAEGGFGADVRRAMDERTDHLVREGLARRYGERVVFQRNLLDTLRRRELDATGADIAGRTGLAYRHTNPGDRIAGTCRQRLALSSGRFAMIDDGLGFRLVPWSNDLERQLGRQVSGIMRDGGGLGWSLGRKRGLGI